MTTGGPESGGGADTAVAVVVVRDGRLPVGADEAVAEAGGRVVVVGTGAEVAADALGAARQARWAETGGGFRPGELAAALAPVVAAVPLVVLPASPDGRDLAPRLAAELDRPLLARAVWASFDPTGPSVRAELTREDDRVLVAVASDGPAVVTLVAGGPRHAGAGPGGSGSGSGGGSGSGSVVVVEPLGTLRPHRGTGGGLTAPGPDPEPGGLVAPDPRTMDLADARRVVTGGAGLAAGVEDQGATARFGLLVEVARALGASAGATRVATDAGWTGFERQVGTTGVAVDPDLVVALGVSGAAQHLGGLGRPRHVVSVNTDPSAPMTAMADLGLVADAGAVLVALADRLGVPVPVGVRPADGVTAKSSDAASGSAGTAQPTGTGRE